MPLSLEDILLGDAADPYASLQEAVVDPFQNLQQIQAQNQQLANLLQSKEQRQAPLQIPIPTLTPEEQSGLLGKIGGKLLGGAAYLGASAGKLGRAVRGTLAGNLRETLNIIPFSDFLRITRPEQEVTGRDLLQKVGLLGENKPGMDIGDVAGFALDIASDPLTYLGGFFGKALTPLGVTASKTGQIAPTLAGKIRAGQAGLANVGLPFGEKLFGIAPKVIGTGETSAKVADVLGKGYKFLADSPLGVTGSALFEKAAQGAATVADRTISRDIYHTTKKRVEEIASQINSYARTLSKQGLDDVAGERALNDLAEGIGEVDRINPVAGVIFKGMHDEMQAGLNAMQDMGAPVGTRTPKYAPVHAPKYATGPVTEVVEKGLKGTEQALGRRAGFMKHPEDIFDVPGGKNMVNDLSVDKNLLPEAGDLPTRQQYVLKKAFGWTARQNDDYADLVVSKKMHEMPSKPPSELVGPRAIKIAEKRGPGAVVTNEDMADAARELTELRDKAIGLNAEHGQAANLADYFGNAHRAYTETGIPLYANSALHDMGSRLQAGAKIEIALNKTHEVLSSNAVFDKIKPVVYETVRHKPKKEGFTLMSDAFEQLGLTERAMKHQGQRLLDAGIIGDIRDVADTWVPNEVVKSLSRNLDVFRAPAAVGNITKVYDWFTNMFKAGVYAPWPASTIRDYTSGLAALAVAAEKPTSLLSNAKWARRVLEGKLAPNELAHAERLVEQLAARGVNPQLSQVSEIAGEFIGKTPVGLRDIMSRLPENRPLLEAIKQYKPAGWQELVKFWDVKGVGTFKQALKGESPLVDKFAPIRGGRATKQYSDMMNKLTLAKNLDEAGYSIDEIMKRVNSSLVDYTDLTDFEKTIMRRAIPFYTFTRHMIPFTVQQMMTKPGGAWATAMKAEHRIQQQQQFTPEYLSQGLAIPLGGDEQNKRFLTSLGLPFESPAEMLRSGPGAVSRNLLTVAGQLNPLIKGPLEFATQKQFFSGRDIGELYSTTGVPGLDQLIANSPASRIMSTIRTIVDPRKSLMAKATNLLTGARITDVDFAKAQAITISDAINRELKQIPGAKKVTHTYVPKDIRETLNQDQLMLLGLQRAKLKEARERAKEIRESQ